MATKFKVGDYIWHEAGPVGWGVVTGIRGRAIQYDILIYVRKSISAISDHYTCEAADYEMTLVSEEEVLRLLLAGGETE